MEADLGQLIAAVQPESIADELGLAPGDRLLAVDGQPVRDVFDYRTRTSAEALVLSIRKADGELLLLDIEKDEDEDLGLDFANPMLDDCRNCHNRCVFCFIDQLPEGMRPSLYFKDDDLRLSFLTGNYVTLTNMTPEELDRIIEYRFSPLNISVHATDPAVRRRMMRNRQAGDLMPALRRITAAGIRINAQIVLVPGYNDGDALHRTLDDLAALAPALQSVAIVPVGITRHREQRGLPALRAVAPEEAQSVIALTAEWQSRFLGKGFGRTLYAADEFYLKAGAAFPPVEAYEDFPQLENGVGMIPLFRQELAAGLKRLSRRRRRSKASPGLAATEPPALPLQVLLVTGTAAGPLMAETASQAANAFGIEVAALPVANRFFGETITVAGLLTGQDVLAALRECAGRACDAAAADPRPESQEAAADPRPESQETDSCPPDPVSCQLDRSEPPGRMAAAPAAAPDRRTVALVPECMLRAGTHRFLDDLTTEELALQAGCEIRTVRPDADSLLEALDRLAGKPGHAGPRGPSGATRRAGSPTERLSTAERPDSMTHEAERPDSMAHEIDAARA